MITASMSHTQQEGRCKNGIPIYTLTPFNDIHSHSSVLPSKAGFSTPDNSFVSLTSYALGNMSSCTIHMTVPIYSLTLSLRKHALLFLLYFLVDLSRPYVVQINLGFPWFRCYSLLFLTLEVLTLHGLVREGCISKGGDRKKKSTLKFKHLLCQPLCQ